MYDMWHINTDRFQDFMSNTFSVEPKGTSSYCNQAGNVGAVYTRQRPHPKCTQKAAETPNQPFPKGLQIPENGQNTTLHNEVFNFKPSQNLSL